MFPSSQHSQNVPRFSPRLVSFVTLFCIFLIPVCDWIPALRSAPSSTLYILKFLPLKGLWRLCYTVCGFCVCRCVLFCYPYLTYFSGNFIKLILFPQLLPGQSWGRGAQLQYQIHCFLIHTKIQFIAFLSHWEEDLCKMQAGLCQIQRH